ncbi:ABC transporter substrate-binding protein [Peribacillus loiseleuriae]|uniref:ABC transporter substrate-binding protein n=1 Tax=Peribacillus loiseleuriae TaxID=1679170 RepID=A0A0K9GWH2_9BACI|nr:extracellular solute-binding protein [Peribacillus loiseleuriae]KMY50980.1 hypothetical protein AC625_16790 [Peribacillus loiseleuriae]
MAPLLRIVPVLCILGLSACNQATQTNIQQEKVSLEFFTPKDETETIFEELINEFEAQNPEVEINQVIVPNGMNVLKTRIARGDTPDLFVTYPIEQDYVIRAKNGYLLDLSDEKFIRNIEPSIQDRYLVNGRMFGIALTQNAVGVLYNKNHFKELNLTVPETWDSFIETMEKLKAAGKTPMLMPNSEADQTSIFNLNLVANQFDNNYWEQGEITIKDSREWKDISKKILTVLSYVQPNSFSDDFFEANQKFAQEEGTMYIMGTWALPEIEKINPDLNYGIFPFPATNQADDNIVLGGVDIGLAISSDTPYPEEAKKFLEFLTQAVNAQRLSDYEGSISTVRGVENKREEVSKLFEKIKEGKSKNWPNHYWRGGTASESDFRKYSLQFFYDKNVSEYLGNLDKMFQQYNSHP